MPIYTYKCEQCKVERDMLRKVHRRNLELKCKKCGSAMYRQVETANFSLKGDGFYKPSPTKEET